MSVTFDFKELERLEQELLKLDGHEIAFGVLNEDAESIHPKSQSATIGEIAFWNHDGTTRIGEEGEVEHIPPRPFLRNAAMDNLDKIQDWLESGYKQVLEGGRVEVLTAKVGIELVKLVQKTIVDFSDPPNAPRTIKRKGFNDPLIWTQTLVEAISSEFRAID